VTPRRGKTGRALLENLAMLTASTIDYWRTYADFREDWQFELSWKSQRRRFFTSESPKMDSNSFWFNWSHAGSGGGYYNLARSNGLTSAGSFLFSVGEALLWEVVCEWREVISTNDLIFTSFGGPAIGEPLYQVGSYFSHRRGFLGSLAAFLTDPFLAVNNWFDSKGGRAANSAPDAAWHRFILFAGSRSGSIAPLGTRYRNFDFGLDMETVTIPGYGEAESFSRWLADTLSSRIFLDFSFSPSGLEEFDIRTQAVFFGLGWQSGGKAGDGSPRGVCGSLGLGSGFEVWRKRPVAWYDSNAHTLRGDDTLTSDARYIRPTPTEFTDKLSAINLAGPVLKLSRFGPGPEVRWSAEAYGDFAMVNALAYNRYTENHDVEGVKSTLLNWGYYYALGWTLATDVEADWLSWRLKAALVYDRFGSIQGQDRFQFLGVVTDDSPLSDWRRSWRASLGYVLPHTPIELSLAAEGLCRSGRILEVSDRYNETRVYYRLNIVF
jgi:hypothetical protein